MVDKWNEIMYGLPPKEIGGNHKKAPAQRNLLRKGDRRAKEVISEGSVGKRSSSSTEPFKKKKISGGGFARGLGPNLSDRIISEVKEDRTKSARNMRHSSKLTKESAAKPFEVLNLKRANLGPDSPI
jgi:hypothetical protein